MHSILLLAMLALPPAPAGPAPADHVLRGRVTDSTGTPIPYALVRVLEVGRNTQTDQDGRYSLGNLPSITARVSFSALGYAPQVRQVALRDTLVELNVVLTASLIELPSIQVTASAIATTSLESPQPVNVMDRSDVEVARSPTLGEMVATVPGVRDLSTGQGIGKPVIRGLTSTNVLVMDNGQRMETQQWGDEHGPNIEAASAERVEIIKGPASVLYGSDAVGGVINVIQPDLPDAIGRSAFLRGNVALGYTGNGPGPDGTVNLEGATGHVGANATFTGRHFGDISTPAGTLDNSGDKTWNAGGNIGVRDSWGNLQGGYVHRAERIEIYENPAEDPGATPWQQVDEDRARLTGQLPVGGAHLDVAAYYEKNVRQEFEEAGATEPSLQLAASTWSGDVKMHHPAVGPFAGIVGLAGLQSSVDKSGEEPLVPDSRTGALGAFIYEQAESGPWSFSLGLRYDYRQLSVDADPELGVVAQTRDYNSVAGSAGALYRLSKISALVANVGRGYRSPTVFELFSNGVHEGTQRYEVGDSTLVPVTSLNIDLAYRLQSSRVRMEVGVFANQLQNFIYPNPTGQIDSTSGLQIYDITQGNSTLYGFEAAVQWHATTVLHFSGTSDYVHGQNTSIDAPLPQIPPFRATYGFRLEAPDRGLLVAPYLGAIGETIAQQTRYPPDDYSPPGYTIFGLGLGTGFQSSRQVIQLDIQVRNLFDTAYRSYLSRYKTYADNPGRNMIVRLSTTF
ncbi:MAG: TonB-dependent receptor [Gemmatimonadales bacterium]